MTQNFWATYGKSYNSTPHWPNFDEWVSSRGNHWGTPFKHWIFNRWKLRLIFKVMLWARSLIGWYLASIWLAERDHQFENLPGQSLVFGIVVSTGEWWIGFWVWIKRFLRKDHFVLIIFGSSCETILILVLQTVDLNYFSIRRNIDGMIIVNWYCWEWIKLIFCKIWVFTATDYTTYINILKIGFYSGDSVCHYVSDLVSLMSSG